MNKTSLKYTHFERLPLPPPVDRLTYIASKCNGLRVLDLGCLDETALVKQETKFWLHRRISEKAKSVLGVDISNKVPPEGLTTSENAKIIHGDATKPESLEIIKFAPEIIVAGEFIEHIANPSEFLSSIKLNFEGKRLLLSTPNGCGMPNTLLGSLKREVQHPDHLHNFTFKTLNTMCIRAEFRQWKIIPYHFFATEMILTNRGIYRYGAIIAEKIIRLLEKLFPSLSFGYIIDIEI